MSRVVSHRPSAVILTLAAVFLMAALAWVAFPGNPAAVALSLLVGSIVVVAAGAAVLSLRYARRSANELRRLGRLVKHTRTLEGGLARIEAGVAAGASATAVTDLARRLGEVESAVAVTNRLLADRVRPWDITRLHTDLLNDQQAMLQLVARHQPEAPLPPVAGWAMNPSGLLWLVDYVEQTRPNLIVECGSGTSSVWLATALRRSGTGRLLSIDHDPDFAAQTRRMLDRHGLSDWVEVRCCPLVTTTTSRGDFGWYDLDPEGLDSIDLLVVDGPPGATGPHARYPALPILASRLASDATVVLDDTGRKEEQEILGYWLEDDPTLRSLGEVSRGLSALTRATVSAS